MLFDPQIEQDILAANDLIITRQYESAAPGYENIESEDLYQDQYKDRRRIKKLIQSSIIVGYKIDYMYTHMYPRDSKKFGAIRKLNLIMSQL